MKTQSNPNFVEVDELHAILGGAKVIARGTLYNSVKSGQIPCVKFGRRILIPKWYVEKITIQDK